MELAEEVGGEAVGVAVVADQQSPWEGHCVTAVFLQILWREKKMSTSKVTTTHDDYDDDNDGDDDV